MISTSKKLILIIEDNAGFSMLVKARLEMNGYEVITTQNGLEGLSETRRKKPDLILLDLMLPGMDGHRICRMIKFDQKLKDIPVIILTSRDTVEDAELARKFRADAYIIKTTKSEIMLSVVKKLLKKRTTL